MRASRLLLLPAIGLATCILLIAALNSSSAGASQLSGPPFLYQTPGPMQPAPGLVPPRGRASTNSSAVVFSTQDVQAYVLAHGFVGGPVVPGHTLKVLNIQLMTPQQADAQGAELESYTSTKMVYVVKMEGPFYTTNVKAPANGNGPATAPTGYEIFDAHTGDMLEWGLP